MEGFHDIWASILNDKVLNKLDEQKERRPAEVVKVGEKSEMSFKSYQSVKKGVEESKYSKVSIDNSI